MPPTPSQCQHRRLHIHCRRRLHYVAACLLSPSAHPGATGCGVRALALAPNSGAYFLLTVFDGAAGQGGRDRVRRCARTPHTRPRARAATPPACRTEPARVCRPPPTFHPRHALAAPPHGRRRRRNSRAGRRRRRRRDARHRRRSRRHRLRRRHRRRRRRRRRPSPPFATLLAALAALAAPHGTPLSPPPPPPPWPPVCAAAVGAAVAATTVAAVAAAVAAAAVACMGPCE